MRAAWVHPMPLHAFARSMLCLLGVAVSSGCASGPMAWEAGPPGVYRHARLGYAIGAPEATPSATWRPVEIDGTDLAFRNGTGSSISLSSSCRKTRASTEMLARHLAIGTRRESVTSEGPVEHAGGSGWTQTFETREGEVRLTLKTVTLVSGRCVYDWVLVARHPDDFRATEFVFDAWWQSFVAPSTGASA